MHISAYACKPFHAYTPHQLQSAAHQHLHVLLCALALSETCTCCAQQCSKCLASVYRDGINDVHFLGIDVSMEALHMARASLSKQCPELSAKNIEMVCADYLEGLKEARARCEECIPINSFCHLGACGTASIPVQHCIASLEICIPIVSVP